MSVDDRHSSPRPADADFASVFRQAVAIRRVSLRGLQQRLRDRGYDVSPATLSQWQTGERTPSPQKSLGVLEALEDVLRLDNETLIDLVRARRRVSADGFVPFDEVAGVGVSPLVEREQSRELMERSGMVTYDIDARGQIERTVVRTLWQARVDGAQFMPMFVRIDDAPPPTMRGLRGCEILAREVDEERGLLRLAMKLHSPLRKGDLAVAEYESVDHVHGDSEPEDEFAAASIRRQVEVGIHVNFDPAMSPRRCTAMIDERGRSRSYDLALNGYSASLVEFNFGPGLMSIAVEW